MRVWRCGVDNTKRSPEYRGSFPKLWIPCWGSQYEDDLTLGSILGSPIHPSIPLNSPYSSPLYNPLYNPSLRSLDSGSGGL